MAVHRAVLVAEVLLVLLAVLHQTQVTNKADGSAEMHCAGHMLPGYIGDFLGRSQKRACLPP